MPGLRLTQKNIATELRPTKDDLLIAGETPRFDGVRLRIVRMRVAENGVAERAVSDIACVPGNFWHCCTHLSSEQMEQLRAALGSAKVALARVKVGKDENGHYRLIDCRLEGRRSALKMRYLGDVAEHDVPEFEAAWSMIVGLFPPL
jgi:hypothetical protein